MGKSSGSQKASVKRPHVSKCDAMNQSLSQLKHINETKTGGYRHKHKMTIISGLKALGAPADSLPETLYVFINLYLYENCVLFPWKGFGCSFGTAPQAFQCPLTQGDRLPGCGHLFPSGASIHQGFLLGASWVLLWRPSGHHWRAGGLRVETISLSYSIPLIHTNFISDGPHIVQVLDMKQFLRCG